MSSERSQNAVGSAIPWSCRAASLTTGLPRNTSRRRRSSIRRCTRRLDIPRWKRWWRAARSSRRGHPPSRRCVAARQSCSTHSVTRRSSTRSCVCFEIRSTAPTWWNAARRTSGGSAGRGRPGKHSPSSSARRRVSSRLIRNRPEALRLGSHPEAATVHMLKAVVRRLLPRQVKSRLILGGPLRGKRLVTSWHDYPGALLGRTERELLSWLRGAIVPGQTWIDVGAHYGYTALAMSESVQAGGRVFAFEPYLPTAGALAQTVALN